MYELITYYAHAHFSYFCVPLSRASSYCTKLKSVLIKPRSYPNSQVNFIDIAQIY